MNDLVLLKSLDDALVIATDAFNEENFKKVIKLLNYYKKNKKNYNMIVVDYFLLIANIVEEKYDIVEDLIKSLESQKLSPEISNFVKIIKKDLKKDGIIRLTVTNKRAEETKQKIGNKNNNNFSILERQLKNSNSFDFEKIAKFYSNNKIIKELNEYLILEEEMISTSKSIINKFINYNEKDLENIISLSEYFTNKVEYLMYMTKEELIAIIQNRELPKYVVTKIFLEYSFLASIISERDVELEVDNNIVNTNIIFSIMKENQEIINFIIEEVEADKIKSIDHILILILPLQIEMRITAIAVILYIIQKENKIKTQKIIELTGIKKETIEDIILLVIKELKKINKNNI